MSYFYIGLYILFFVTAIVYIVYLSLTYYIHEKRTTYIVVPFLFTFNVFAVGFFIVCIVSLIITYLPGFIKLFYNF